MKPFEQATTEELRAMWEEKHGTPEIVPAEPLTEPLEVEQLYYYPLGETLSVSRWDNDEMDHYRLKEKMIFPNSPEGKAGAELRAKVPHPGIHWQKDLKLVRIWWNQVREENCWDQDSGAFHVADFLDKYLPE